MRLVLFVNKGASTHRVGLQLEGKVADVSSVAEDRGFKLHSMRAFLDLGESRNDLATTAASNPVYHRELSTIDLKAPIYDPEKVICVGMNYVDHCTEQNVAIPVEPLIFSKFPSCIIGPGEDLVKPRETAELDYEVELVIVIGKDGRRISKEDALEHVVGMAHLCC
jgi:2-keto-4-pentenoate hydratase/2-oxohepta-3-ene-1,7-dioic acid hydratase in catechol pathway